MGKSFVISCWVISLCFLFGLSACETKEEYPVENIINVTTAAPQLYFFTVEELADYFQEEGTVKKYFPSYDDIDGGSGTDKWALFTPVEAEIQKLLGAEMAYIALTESLNTIEFYFAGPEAGTGAFLMPPESGQEMTVSFTYGWPGRSAYLTFKDSVDKEEWVEENGCYYVLETAPDEASERKYTIMWSGKGMAVLASGVPEERGKLFMDKLESLFTWMPI